MASPTTNESSLAGELAPPEENTENESTGQDSKTVKRQKAEYVAEATGNIL